jgi:hypothetical protein
MEDDDAPSPEEEVPAEVIAAEGTTLLCFSDAHPIFQTRPSLTIQLGSCIADMQRKKTSSKYLSQCCITCKPTPEDSFEVRLLFENAGQSHGSWTMSMPE